MVLKGLASLEVALYVQLVALAGCQFLELPNRSIVIGEGIAEAEYALPVGRFRH